MSKGGKEMASETHKLLADIWCVGIACGKDVDNGTLEAGALIRHIEEDEGDPSDPDIYPATWDFEASTDGGRTWHRQRSYSAPQLSDGRRHYWTVIVKDGEIVTRSLQPIMPRIVHSCNHNHRSREAAESCRTQLLGWSQDGRTCSAKWYNAVIHEHVSRSMDYVR